MQLLTPFVVLFAAVASGQDSPKYSDPSLGLTFTYPKKWVAGKKTKDTTLFTFPVGDTDVIATIEISRVPYRSDKETWQTIQTRVNEQLHRTVIRQWEQEVLQVPMLLTQTGWNDHGIEKTTLTGLLYTRSVLKMLVKLTAPTSQFTAAEAEYFDVLQSLRTLDGSNPTEDDPSVKIDPPKPKVAAPPKIKVIDGNAPKEKLVVPPVEVPLVVSTKPVKLRLPETWQADGISGGTMTLRSKSLSGSLKAEIRSLLDSDPALTAMLKVSSGSLAEFSKVAKREDTNNIPNRAGCRISSVWRTGKGKSGDLLSHESVGLQGQFYILITYRQSDPNLFKADQAAIKALLDQVNLESPAE